MTTSTFGPVACPSDDWTVILAGTSFQTIGLQLGSHESLAIAVATSKPALSATEFIALERNGERSVTIDIAASDIVYGRGISGASAVRGFKVSR